MIAFETFTPVRLAELVGGEDRAGALYGPAAAAAWALFAAGSWLAGPASRRFGVARTAVAARLLNGLFVIGMGVVSGPVGLVAAYWLAYATHGSGNPVHAALLHRQAEAGNRVTVLSVNSMVSGGVYSLGLLALGPLAEHTSIATAILVAGAFSLLGAFCYRPALKEERTRLCTAGGRLRRPRPGRLRLAGGPCQRGPTADVTVPESRGGRPSQCEPPGRGECGVGRDGWRLLEDQGVSVPRRAVGRLHRFCRRRVVHKGPQPFDKGFRVFLRDPMSDARNGPAFHVVRDLPKHLERHVAPQAAAEGEHWHLQLGRRMSLQPCLVVLGTFSEPRESRSQASWGREVPRVVLDVVVKVRRTFRVVVDQRAQERVLVAADDRLGQVGPVQEGPVPERRPRRHVTCQQGGLDEHQTLDPLRVSRGEEVRHDRTEVVPDKRHAVDPTVVQHRHEVLAAQCRAVSRERPGRITKTA